MGLPDGERVSFLLLTDRRGNSGDLASPLVLLLVSLWASKSGGENSPEFSFELLLSSLLWDLSCLCLWLGLGLWEERKDMRPLVEREAGDVGSIATRPMEDWRWMKPGIMEALRLEFRRCPRSEWGECEEG